MSQTLQVGSKLGGREVSDVKKGGVDKNALLVKPFKKRRRLANIFNRGHGKHEEFLNEQRSQRAKKAPEMIKKKNISSGPHIGKGSQYTSAANQLFEFGDGIFQRLCLGTVLHLFFSTGCG